MRSARPLRHQHDPLPVLLEDEAHRVAAGMGLAHGVVLALKFLVALQFRRLGHPSHRQHWQIRSFPSTMGRV